MGCDIHMVAEVKKNGKWVPYPNIWPGGRSYTLFGILAGVRDPYPEPLQEERGIPEDSNVRRNSWGDPEIDGVWLGDHSYGWLSLGELLDYKPRTEEEKTAWEWFDTEVITELKLLGGPNNVRIVFGFDS